MVYLYMILVKNNVNQGAVMYTYMYMCMCINMYIIALTPQIFAFLLCSITVPPTTVTLLVVAFDVALATFPSVCLVSVSPLRFNRWPLAALPTRSAGPGSGPE